MTTTKAGAPMLVKFTMNDGKTSYINPDQVIALYEGGTVGTRTTIVHTISETLYGVIPLDIDSVAAALGYEVQVEHG